MTELTKMKNKLEVSIKPLTGGGRWLVTYQPDGRTFKVKGRTMEEAVLRYYFDYVNPFDAPRRGTIPK